MYVYHFRHIVYSDQMIAADLLNFKMGFIILLNLLA